MHVIAAMLIAFTSIGPSGDGCPDFTTRPVPRRVQVGPAQECSDSFDVRLDDLVVGVGCPKFVDVIPAHHLRVHRKGCGTTTEVTLLPRTRIDLVCRETDWLFLKFDVCVPSGVRIINDVEDHRVIACPKEAR